MTLAGRPPLASEVTSSVSVVFSPNESVVTGLSQMVKDFCRVGEDGDDLGERFRIAAHELGENIVRYSKPELVSLSAELTESNGARYLVVRSQNQALPEHLARATQRLETLRGCDDPRALYRKMLRESAPREGVSGLGLARIVADAGLSIGYEIHGDQLTIEVKRAVPAERAPCGPV